MKTLLFPTDFSATADNALDYALNLANSLDARLHIIHTYHYTTVDTSYLPGELLTALEVEKEEEALKVLREYEEKAQKKLGKEVAVIHKLSYGFAQEQILEYAEDVNADLIVMGTTGASNFLGKMLGSITSQVMARAKCPVLAIPSEAKFKEIEEVAYASGFADGESDIFERLLKFASLLNAKLSCVHIHTQEENVKKTDVWAYDEYFKEKVRTHQLDYYMINHEDPEEGLDQFVKINKTDILVMMTHKRSLLDRLFNPSLSRKMILQSQVPVLVFQKDNLFHLEGKVESQA